MKADALVLTAMKLSVERMSITLAIVLVHVVIGLLKKLALIVTTNSWDAPDLTKEDAILPMKKISEGELSFIGYLSSRDETQTQQSLI